VSVPVDDWDRPCEPVAVREVSQSVSGDPMLLRGAAARLAAAQRPVFIVGAEVARDGAWQEAVTLAEQHQAPVWASPMSARNSFPEQHPLFAGFLPADRAAIVASLQGYDLVLVLGAPVFTYHVEGVGPHIPAGSFLVQLTNDPAAAARAPVGLSIVTNLRLGIGALRAVAAPARVAAAVRRRAPLLPPQRLTDGYLLQQIAALRPSDSIVVEEAPSSRPAMHDYLPFSTPDSFYTCASGGLGHGLPAAVGVALARPGCKVISILGDGSAMYAIQGLWSAAELAVPVAFVIINNGGYRALDEFAPHFGLATPPGTRLAHLDFCALARAQGIEAVRVSACAELDAALRMAFRATQPILLEVCVAR
jgi:benzoylformate decarboxylase